MVRVFDSDVEFAAQTEKALILYWDPAVADFWQINQNILPITQPSSKDSMRSKRVGALWWIPQLHTYPESLQQAVSRQEMVGAFPNQRQPDCPTTALSRHVKITLFDVACGYGTSSQNCRPRHLGIQFYVGTWHLLPNLVVHSVGIPPESDESGTKVTGRHGMVPEQAPECVIILS
jgi:hypothetical protein